jgi:ribosomal-protein-alanine N-acetyltransferase
MTDRTPNLKRPLKFTPITEPEAREVLNWEYPDIGTYHYYAVRDERGELVGFCCYGEDAQVWGGDYALAALDVGLGLRPDLIGHGLSHGFLAAILDWGRELFAPECFRATVAAVNARSQGLFARAGFLIVQRFVALTGEPHEFVVMLRAEE